MKDITENIEKMGLIPKNQFERLFLENTGKRIHKWWHYLEVYERHFRQFQDKPVRILEIGVQAGGSLQLWQKYFKEATIFGLDVDPRCKKFEDKNIHVFIGSQGDLNFLEQIKQEIQNIDIIIDDGSHFFHHQILTLETLYPMMNEGGIYLCEDTHTSYYPSYGGSLKNPSTFIEYSKNLVDKLNFTHNSVERDYIALNTFSVSFYDSIVILEKRKMTESWHSRTGSTEGF